VLIDASSTSGGGGRMRFRWSAVALNDAANATIDDLNGNLTSTATTGYAFIPSDLMAPGGSYRFSLTAFSLFAVRCHSLAAPTCPASCAW
jgi:hypothetical protein